MIHVWQMNDYRWQISATTNAELKFPDIFKIIRKHAELGFNSRAAADDAAARIRLEATATLGESK